MNQQDRELLRTRVVGYLATRQGLEFESGSICRSIKSRQQVDFEITPEDVVQALTFAEGFKWVERSSSEVGSTVYWRSTSQGVLEAERKGWLV